LRRAVAVLAVALFAFAAATLPAFAQTETILYSFCPQKGCADGNIPSSGLIRDSPGNFYGVAEEGGTNGQGVVFKLTPKGTESVLYSFGAVPNDGIGPQGQLSLDTQGNLYGTTVMGGSNDTSRGGDGTVFKLSPDGTETILHNFGATSTDGIQPQSGVVMDAEGNLFGTTYYGGVYGAGTVFRVTPEGVETKVHSFANNSTDGGYPWSAPIIDTNGNLYGTTRLGGTGGGGISFGGTVFEISRNGGYSVLHNFAGLPTDGSLVEASLTLDSQGNLYGATYGGGSYDAGTVFRLARGSNGSWDETILYNFTLQYPTCQSPVSAVLFDAKGNLYGTTWTGGSGEEGCVYKISPAGKLTIVHAFGPSHDGESPDGNLLFSQGNLYGVTLFGGNYDVGYGAIFKIKP
jgi:uncharacterized repeat protein (TIGR03803 family)